MNQPEFGMDKNYKENIQYDHIPFNMVKRRNPIPYDLTLTFTTQFACLNESLWNLSFWNIWKLCMRHFS